MLRRLLFLACLLVPIACDSEHARPADDVLVRVGYVAIDPRAGSPMVVLEEQSGNRTLPIWIGFAEARSIASEIEHRRSPRPNTHDLAKQVLVQLESRVERVVVTELREGTYYAVLMLNRNGRRLELDARPSDAIALALRFEAPVFVRASLFEAEPLPVPDGPERQASRVPAHVPAGWRKADGNWRSGVPTAIRETALPVANRPGVAGAKLSEVHLPSR